MNSEFPDDEKQLLEQSREGDAEAYALLVDRYKDMTFTLAYRMLGDQDSANDMAQETFISAYQGLAQFRAGSKFSTWLTSIVLNKCRDHLRARKKIVSVDGLEEELAAPDESPEAAASGRQTRDAVQSALAGIPPDYREVLVLKHIEGLDYREIAEITGDSIAALKVRAHRGREMLKQQLEAREIMP